MAIDPRIVFGLQTGPSVQEGIGAGMNAVAQGQQIAANRQVMESNRQAAELAAEQAQDQREAKEVITIFSGKGELDPEKMLKTLEESTVFDAETKAALQNHIATGNTDALAAIKKMAKNLLEFDDTGLKVRKVEAQETANEQRELERLERARQFNLKQGELKPTMQKILDGAQTDAINAGKEAREMEVLADDFSKQEFEGGIVGNLADKVKDLTGNQDGLSNLRKGYNKIRASQATQNLPPGPASDKDIALALSGFPTGNFNKSQMVSFLRGVAKLQRFNEEFNTFKSTLISEKGSTKNLLRDWKAHVEAKDTEANDRLEALRAKHL